MGGSAALSASDGELSLTQVGTHERTDLHRQAQHKINPAASAKQLKHWKAGGKLCISGLAASLPHPSSAV